VGDVIMGDGDWTKVTRTWDKGVKSTLAFHLNNGSTMTVTGDHKVFKVPRRRGGKHGTANLPGARGTEQEVRARDLKVGDELLQPESLPFGITCLGEDWATLVGAYLAEGWSDSGRVGIAGIPGSKGLREIVLQVGERLGLKPSGTQRPAVFFFGKKIVEWCQQFGRGALNKALPHLDYDEEAVKAIVAAMERGDGGRTKSGTMVYSTISPTLAIQYRLMQRMLGRSTHLTRVDNHGGLGSHPIYRVTVRSEKNALGRVTRPWARIRAIEDAGLHQVYDLEVESHRIYLPEVDVIVHNCDDMTILIAAMAKIAGYPVKARVIRTTGAEDWNHIYALVGTPPMKPKKWVPMDASVKGKKAGWEAPASMIADKKDFPL
jgi:hypothetical protein